MSRHLLERHPADARAVLSDPDGIINKQMEELHRSDRDPRRAGEYQCHPCGEAVELQSTPLEHIVRIN